MVQRALVLLNLSALKTQGAAELVMGKLFAWGAWSLDKEPLIRAVEPNLDRTLMVHPGLNFPREALSIWIDARSPHIRC